MSLPDAFSYKNALLGAWPIFDKMRMPNREELLKQQKSHKRFCHNIQFTLYAGIALKCAHLAIPLLKRVWSASSIAKGRIYPHHVALTFFLLHWTLRLASMAIKNEANFKKLAFTATVVNCFVLVCLGKPIFGFGAFFLALGNPHIWAKWNSKVVQEVLNYQDPNQNSTLHEAVMNGNLDAVQQLLNEGIDINSANNLGNTPLHLAVIRNKVSTPSSEDYVNKKILQAILDKNPNINAVNKQGNTPLHLALQENSSQSCELILNRNPNLKIQNNHGDTALHLAASRNVWCLGSFQPIIKKLLDIDPCIHLQNKEGQTVFHLAAKAGQLESLNRIKPYATGNLSEELGQRDHFGKKPIMYAIEEGQYHLLACLLDGDDNLLQGSMPVQTVFNMLHQKLKGTVKVINDFQTYNDPLGGEKWITVLSSYLNVNILEFPFLFHDVAFAKRLFPTLTDEDFISNMDYLTKRYSAKMVQWLAQERKAWKEEIEIDPSFYQIHEKVIPDASKYLSFHESRKRLEKMLSKAQNTDRTQPGYVSMDPKTVEDGIKKVLDTIAGKGFWKNLTGEPGTERYKTYYQNLENMIRHMAIFLSEPDDPLRATVNKDREANGEALLPILDDDHRASALKELANASAMCGTGQMGEAFSAYELLKGNIADSGESSLEEDVAKCLQNFREKIVDRLTQTHRGLDGFVNSGNVHIGLQYRNYLADRGIKGSDLQSEDDYGDKTFTPEVAKHHFDKYCCFSGILEAMDEAINGSMGPDGKRIITGKLKPTIDSGKLLDWLLINFLSDKQKEKRQLANQLVAALEKLKKKDLSPAEEETEKKSAQKLAEQLGLPQVPVYMDAIKLASEAEDYIRKEFHFNEETNEWGMGGILRILLHPKMKVFRKS